MKRVPPADSRDEYPGAERFFPERGGLGALRAAARSCRGCPLYRNATQTVFGEGLLRARLMLVGEMPGNDEDLEGHPFVGPAGRVLDRALDAAGISRDDAYVTNVVKHFKWEPKGPRRLHKTPNAREIRACRPWLDAEIDLVRPRVLVALGATAARALFGNDFRVTRNRGRLIESSLAPRALATVHPSSILRARTDAERHQAMARFIDDMTAAGRALKDAPGPPLR